MGLTIEMIDRAEDRIRVRIEQLAISNPDALGRAYESLERLNNTRAQLRAEERDREIADLPEVIG